MSSFYTKCDFVPLACTSPLFQLFVCLLHICVFSCVCLAVFLFFCILFFVFPVCLFFFLSFCNFSLLYGQFVLIFGSIDMLLSTFCLKEITLWLDLVFYLKFFKITISQRCISGCKYFWLRLGTVKLVISDMQTAQSGIISLQLGVLQSYRETTRQHLPQGYERDNNSSIQITQIYINKQKLAIEAKQLKKGTYKQTHRQRN